MTEIFLGLTVVIGGLVLVVIGGLVLVVLSLIEPLVRNNAKARSVLDIVGGLLALLVLGFLVMLGGTLWKALPEG